MRHAAAITEQRDGQGFSLCSAWRHGTGNGDDISTEIIAGGGIPRFVVVTAGDRSALADADATTKPLTPGRPGRVRRWAARSMAIGLIRARTAVVGEPSRDQQARYDALLEGELAQLALPVRGISAW